MANPFDQFDQAQSKPGRANPFDQFDAAQSAPAAPASPAAKHSPSAPSGFMRGLLDPIDGGAQLLTHILPEGVVEDGNRLNNWLADKGVPLAKIPENNLSALVTGQKGGLDVLLQQQEQEYQAARKAAGETGFDAGRFAGNLLSPATAAMAYVAPMGAATTMGRALQGAAAGVAGTALAPVHDGGRDYWTEKAIQAGTGAAGGAVLTPIAGKVGEAIVSRVRKASPEEVVQQVDAIMREGVNRMRREGLQPSQDQIMGLRDQVVQALKEGRQVDPAALMRQADFEALGMKGTLGQITRNSGQFAREKNLRGVSGVGDPLLERFDQQSSRLQELVTGRANGAADEYTAGQGFISTLKGVDDGMRREVTDLYGSARKSAGKDMDIPLQGLAQDYAEVLRNFGDKIPAGVRNAFEDLGLMGNIAPKMHGGGVKISGNQTKVFNFEEADKLQKIINDNVSNDPATNKALGYLREALKRAQTDVAADGGPFAPAVAAARKRFALHEASPALRAAAEGDIPAQDFVRRYLINGKAEEVRKLAEVMPDEARQEARRQFGVALERAAFGANAAGDKAFAQESFNRFLNTPGMRQKLTAFFDKSEIDQIDRIGRVGAYMNSIPANSAVNTSNSAAQVFNLLSRLPGVPAGVGVLQNLKNTASSHMDVNRAIRAPSVAKAGLTPQQQALIARYLGIAPAGVGVATATAIE